MGGASGVGMGWEERMGAVSRAPGPQSKPLPSCGLLAGGGFSGSCPVRAVACLQLPGPQVYRLLPPMPGSALPGRPGRSGSTNGDAHWQTGCSAGHSRAVGGVMEPLAQPTGPTRLQGRTSRIVFQSVTLASSREASGLIRQSFLEAALVPRRGPDFCNISSTQAQMLSKPPPRVPGLTSVAVSPQVPCRLRAVRSRTKASTSVWRPTLKAHATRPPPTSMCEVSMQAEPSPVSTELNWPCWARCPEPLVWTVGAAVGPVSPFLPLSAAARTAVTALPLGRLPMSTATFPSFSAGPLGGSRSWEHLYLL